MKKVGVVTTSRADFGLLYPIMTKIEESKQLELEVIATGMHLVKDYGNTIEYVKSKFPQCRVVDVFLPNINQYTLTKSIGIGFMSFSEYLHNNELDYLIVLGDRVELMVPVYSAMIYNIPIVHIFGGDSIDDYVTYDNNVRHAITKLANVHFTATEEHSERIKKMGEEPWRVITVGSPALDNISSFRPVEKDELQEKIEKININNPFTLMTYHPVHMEISEIKTQIKTILKVVKDLGIQVICTKPNNDIGNEVILEEIKRESRENSNFYLVDSITQEEYYSLMKYCEFMMGNSSSGILESSSFKKPSIDIGSRQKGRIKGANVINTGTTYRDISKAIFMVRNNLEFKKNCLDVVNPYGDGKSSERIVRALEEIEFDKIKLLQKKNTY